VQDWKELDLEGSYKPVLASMVGPEPDPAPLKKVTFPGLVMVRPSLARGDYPPVQLPSLEKTLRAMANAPQDEVVIPDHCLVRLVDVTAEPGARYEYQTQVRMANPNFGTKEPVRDPALAEIKTLTGPWAPEKPIYVNMPKD